MTDNSNIGSHRVGTQPLMSDKTYNIMKNLAQIWLPAVGAAYFGLGQIWHLPAPEQVSGSILIIDTFLGAVLGISTKAYNNSDARFDGTIVTENLVGKKVYSLQLDGDPETILDEKSEITFKVIPK